MNGLPANRSCRTLFQTRALTLMPRGAPVLVGHNSEREVGRVDELVEWPDVDGLWLFARCSIDAPPGWLRRGTAASFECLPLRQQRMGDWNRVTRGLFREASIRCCRSGRHSNEAARARLSQWASMLQRANSQRPSTWAFDELVHSAYFAFSCCARLGRVRRVRMSLGSGPGTASCRSGLPVTHSISIVRVDDFGRA